jgi:probable phosphoglycerate mutase
MELILIRHGLPERRADTHDPPLTAAGREQAQRVARRLAGDKVGAVFASTMQRAKETAAPFVAASELNLQLHDGIVEFDRGTGAYVPMEELKRDDYPAWKAFVDEGFADIVSFQNIVIAALEDIVQAHAGGSVAVFCHGGVVNVWTCHVLGMAPRLFFEPAYGSIHRYLCARSGERNLVSLNERDHLRGE